MLDDAKKFWDALSGKVETACRQETRNAFRCGRYDVSTAPNGTTMGVTLPMGDTELFLPYSQEVASAQVGDAVLVVWWGSMSTARVCFFGDGYRGGVTSVNGESGEVTLTASEVGAVADEVQTIAKGTFFSDTSAFPGTVSIKKQGNVIEFYGTFNSTTKPTDGTHTNAIASGFRAAAQYAILPIYSGSSPYLPIGTVWIYQGGTIAFYGTPNGLGYIHGTYICS